MVQYYKMTWTYYQDGTPGGIWSSKLFNHGLVAVPLPDYIQYSNRISRYCHSMTFRQVSTSTDYYKYSFFPLAIVQWNALPSLLHACRALRSLRPQSASCNTLALRSQFSCFYLILANLNYS